MVFGVIGGAARYFNMNAGLLRALYVVACVLTGIWPLVILYAVVALMVPVEPAVPFESVDDREFYHSYVGSRSLALHRLKQTYDSLERRIRRMEDIVTARDYDWERRLHE